MYRMHGYEVHTTLIRIYIYLTREHQVVLISTAMHHTKRCEAVWKRTNI